MSEHPVLKEAVCRYKAVFGENPKVQVFAPGRVNLIGEHTDYNGGFVLPFALPFKTVVVGSLSSRSESRVISCSMKSSQPEEFIIDRNLSSGQPEWVNYVKGTIFQYLDELPSPFAVDICIASNVPIGSGLSSSASLEVAVATFLEKLCGLTTSGVTKALRCQKAEHDFANTPCGIMDQYISAMGKRGNLLLIDCRSNDYTLVPFGDGSNARPPVMLITNSNVKHSLSDSQYPVRVKQCQEAVRILSAKFPHIKSLRDASMENLESVQDELPDVVYRRALHCITEDIRTKTTVEALGKGDFKKVGEQMTMSHASLQESYEVSCAELDLLVELAIEVPGVYGSRMTGGGFGGCTITLVDRDSVRTLEMHLKKHYMEKTGKTCICYDALPSDGAGSFSNNKKSGSNGSSGSISLLSVSVGLFAVVSGLVIYMRDSQH